LQPTSPDPAEVWIGYAFNPRYRGYGYATESVSGLIEWLFARGARRVFANCYLDNIASIALLERLGFTECARYSAEHDATEKHAASCRMRLDPP
jgi:RimJ/RimL family protein N-acetyltransferase